jgi:hypothetical protein
LLLWYRGGGEHSRIPTSIDIENIYLASSTYAAFLLVQMCIAGITRQLLDYELFLTLALVAGLKVTTDLGVSVELIIAISKEVILK